MTAPPARPHERVQLHGHVHGLPGLLLLPLGRGHRHVLDDQEPRRLVQQLHELPQVGVRALRTRPRSKPWREFRCPRWAPESTCEGTGLMPRLGRPPCPTPLSVEVVVRASSTYLARNSSPCAARRVAPWPPAPGCCLARCSSSVIWRRRSACSRRRSSADPPNGLNAIIAAARLAASSAPITPRMATRGSLMAAPATFAPPSLKFLGIGHVVTW